MKFKLRKTFLLAILILACCLVFVSCADGESPVESIAVTSMPVTEYYRGDFFNLNNAVITVYYENGKVETVPVDSSMVSDFDSQQIGEQILTIKYAGQTAYVKVYVSNAPIYSLEVVEDSYKKTYVQGQTLDVKNMNLKIVYTNNFSEIIPVTAEMVENFDTSVSGERELLIFYGDKTTTCLINVVAPSISQIGVEAPHKLEYIVGQTFDFTGSRLFVSYNNNTQRYLEAEEFTASEDFTLLIDGQETDVFTRAGLIYVTYSYFGYTTDFFVTVQDVKATKLEVTAAPQDQPRGSSAPDLSAGRLQVTFNNGDVFEYAMDDAEVAVNWKDFDIGVNGTYDVEFTCAGLTVPYTLRVVEPVEKEMFVDTGDNVYYQDGPEIDVSDWTYRILLTNGQYRQFSGGTEYAYLSEDMIYGAYDLSTDIAGKRTFTFLYESADGKIVLYADAEIEVLEKIPVGIASFTAPDKNVYVQNEALNLTGGYFTVEYNDGSVSSPVALTADMLKGADHTASLGRNVSVEFVYTDPAYGGELTLSYTITVVRRAYSLSFDALSSVGLKLVYVKGETFDSSNLVLRINYLNEGQGETVTDFSGAEWIFEGTYFAETGAKEVTVWYGDKADGIFAVIPVTVTNEITAVEFSEGFDGFGSVVEGVALTVPAGTSLTVTRQNGETETVTVTSAMTDYDKNDLTLGEREVNVTYEGFTVTSSVTVNGRKVTALNVTSSIIKTEYLIGDTSWDFTGLAFVLKYDNGTSVTVKDTAIKAQGDGKYLAKTAGRTIEIIPDQLFTSFDEIYYRQTVTVRVSDITVAGNEVEQIFTFEALIFEQLVTGIKVLFRDQDGNLASVQTAEVYESLDLSYAGMFAEVTFDGGSKTEISLQDEQANFEISGFDKNKAGIQSVKFAYLGRECTFTVNVRSKIVESVSVSPDTVSVIEGMALPSEDMEIVLHFLNADGEEYDEPYYIKTELGNVVCSFDPNATFVFDKTEGGVGYTEQTHTVSYTLNGKTVQDSFTVRIYRKQAVRLAMQDTPKQAYIEHENELSIDGGSVLVYYDNGSRTTLGLESTRLRMDTSEFNTSELSSGAERQVKIYIYFVDDNGREVSTYYNVTVKDRRYFEIVYDEESLVNNEYYFRYGSKEDLRPGFTIYGYITFDGDKTAILTENDYDRDNKGFSLYYVDSSGQRSDEWPTQAGVYTLVIEYAGDGIHNPFYESGRQIRIYAKELAVVAQPKEVTYGDYYSEGTLTYEWILKGYSDTGSIYLDDPLEYDDLPEEVLEVEFEITSLDGSKLNFFTDNDGVTVINLNAGQYVLVPYLGEMLSQNYSVKEFISDTLTVAKKDVSITAKTAEKTYGESDPRFGYTVYDADGNKIGEDGTITLAGRLEEKVPLYTLQRAAGDDNNVGTHPIKAGIESNLANYNVTEFIEGELVIHQKAVSLYAEQSAERIYGKPDAGTEYLFGLAEGETLAYDETFEEIFALLSDYRSGLNEGKVRVAVYLEDAVVYENCVIPTDARAGVYTVRFSLADYASNYDVTIAEFTFEIKPMTVTVELKSAVAVYSEFVDGAELGDKSVYNGDYNLVFGEGYSIDKQPSVTLVKEKGVDAGRYLIGISDDTVTGNPDFSITVKGNFGEFFSEYDFGDYMPELSLDETESASAYLVILPYEFTPGVAAEEVYARKTTLYPDLTFDFGEKTFASSVTDGLKAAIGFSFVNTDPNKAGYGYYTADTYNATLTYDYFATTLGRNFLITGTESNPVDKRAVYAYCFGGEESASAVVYTEEFSYTVTPKVLDIRPDNADVDYTGSEIAVTFTDRHISSVCAGDSLTLGYAVTVLYYGKTDYVATEKVVEAGDYSVSITGIGNFNYRLGEEAASYVHKFTVRTIVLDILINNALPLDGDSEYISAVYNGRKQQPLDNDWSAVANPSDENGYFFTTTQKVVNATSLTSAPKSLRIEPYTLNAEGQIVTPVNAGTYELRWYINAEYTNYSVRFVKRNLVSGGEMYIDADYKFVIEKKEVQLQKVASVASKNYDGKEPEIQNASEILIIDAAGADPVKYTDLVFTFERDMDKIPTELQGLISADDMTSAGYFRISVTSSKTQNYTFVLDTEYYVIKRVPVAVTLNATGYSLTKQYDAYAPSAELSDLRTNMAGAITDDVYIDLESKYFKATSNGSWQTYDSSKNDIGFYAYDFKPYFMVDGVKIYPDEIKYTDEETGNLILSWNYVYYIVKDSGTDTYGCDGVFSITPKEIYVFMEGAENVVDVDSGTMYYMYGVPYANKAVTANEATAQINGIYKISLDGTVDGAIEEAELTRLGFTRTDLSIANTGDITNAGSYFNVQQTALAADNPNFLLVNNPVRYVIKQLEVQLTLSYTNNSNGRNGIVYGEKVLEATKYDNIDFADKEAFRIAMGFAEDYVIDINDWISSSQSDYPNNKFIIGNAAYCLVMDDTSYDLPENTVLNAGIYTSDVEGIYAQNFYFVIIGEEFEIEPKPITVTGAERDYFDKNSLQIAWGIDGNVNKTVEEVLINSVLSKFKDKTNVVDDSGSYSQGDSKFRSYYIQALKEDIDKVTLDYPNYSVDISSVTPTDATEGMIYLPLSVKKLPVTVTITAPGGGSMEFSYGHEIVQADYTIVYSGMPVLDSSSTDYNYADEYLKQNEVKALISGSMLDLPTLFEVMSKISSSDNENNYNLEDYLKEGADTTTDNFDLSFGQVVFKVNKIQINVRMVNNAGTAYNSNGDFSIIYGEEMVYSHTEAERTNYAFEIVNRNSIIGYSEGMSLKQMLGLIFAGRDGNESSADEYEKSVNYKITNKAGSEAVSAGENYIALTDTWYKSENYVIKCEPAVIMIYPKVHSLGTNNVLPYSAISLTGQESDYLGNIRNLGMMVKVNYEGMPEGQESEWVDIRRTLTGNIYDGAYYVRNWNVNFAGEQPTSLKVGDEVELVLSFSENFFNGDASNSIVTKEFKVRIYGTSDSLIKDKTSSDFIFEETSDAFSSIKNSNGTYILSDGKQTTNPYEGLFDIVSADFIFEIKDSENYSAEFILYKNGSVTVKLGFRGGNDYGYYVAFENGTEEHRYENVLKEYDVTVGDSVVTRSVLEDVNLFDGRKHRLTAYLDKIGYIADDKAVNQPSERLYRVLFVIDDVYAYELTFVGGTRTIAFDGETGEFSISYEEYIDFSLPSQTGVIVNECKAYFSRYSLKNMGVGVTTQGYVADYTFRGITDGCLYYLGVGDSIESLFEPTSFNTNDGYAGKYSLNYVYYDAISGQAVEALDEKGFYRVSVTLTVNGQSTASLNLYVIVVEHAYEKTSIYVNENKVLPTYDNPVTIDASTAGSSSFSEMLSTINYSRIVFDFQDESTDTINASLRFILKSSDNTTVDLSSVVDGNYRGVAVAVNRIGETDGTPVYQTVIYVVTGGKSYAFSVDGVDWRGTQNILEATYDYNNGVIYVTLRREGAIVFSKKLYKNNDDGGTIGAGNISTVIGGQEGSSGFTGVFAFRAKLKLYEIRSSAESISLYEWSDFDGNVAQQESLTEGKYLLSDAYGTVRNLYGNSTQFRFSVSNAASDSAIRLMFYNNMPSFIVKAGSLFNQTIGRGAYLELKSNYVRLYLYKEDVIFRPDMLGNVTSTNLLDGNEHTVTVTVTEEKTTISNTIEAYRVYIIIDGTTYSASIPVANDLSGIFTSDGNTNEDPESSYNSADTNFLSSSRYLGVQVIGGATLDLKGIFVF